MNWFVMIEVLVVIAVYLIVDRSAFWFMSNTFNQVSRSSSNISYTSTALPRLVIALLGCGLTVVGRMHNDIVLSIAGLTAIIASLAVLCFMFIRKYWVDPKA